MNFHELVPDLQNEDVYRRHRAASLLEQAPREPEFLEPLARALADPGFYETPGDYDAPPFYYGVAEAAAGSLAGPHAARVLDTILHTMRLSPTAAFHAARVLGSCGAIAPLRELLKHPDASVREQAIQQFPEEPVDPAVLEALMDDSGAVVSQATRLLSGQPLEAPALIPRLVQRMRDEPQAGTFFQAAALFAHDPRVWETWVELALQGSAPAAEKLRQSPERLSPEQMHRLTRAPMSIPLLLLLSGPEAVPVVLPCLQNPELRPYALGALLRLPGGQDQIPEPARWFVEMPRFRAALAAARPELAEQVLPLVRQKLAGTPAEQEDGLSMVAALGQAAASELPRVLRLAGRGQTLRLRLFALDALVGLESMDGVLALLDDPEMQRPALKKVIEMGPRAATLKPYLEILAQERPSELLTQALQAVG